MPAVRIAVLMPAFNEAGRLTATVDELRSLGAGAAITVFLVDDGSDPPIDAKTLDGRDRDKVGVVLARHAVNLGQGAALETARRLALDPRFAPPGGFDAYVTMDADGQHRGVDVLALAEAIASGADVALGDRFAGDSNVPSSRRALLGAARVFERVATGERLSDAHNGLRAFGPRAIAAMRIRHNRMAHATELTHAIARSRGEAGLHVVEVPVSVRYTEASLAKGQSASGAVAILVDLVQGFFLKDHR
jgi:polyprenyl-phospho-N-acetylgalactosaminyl synthase